MPFRTPACVYTRRRSRKSASSARPAPGDSFPHRPATLPALSARRVCDAQPFPVIDPNPPGHPPTPSPYRETSPPCRTATHGYQRDRQVKFGIRRHQQTACGQTHTLSGNDESHFPGFREGCSGNYQPRGNGKTARGIGSADPSMLQPPRNRKPAGDLVGRSNRSEQVWQAPGLREFRLAESQQILLLTGNRKSASDRTHWLQPAPCSSRRRSCPGGERGDRQSSVPVEPTRHGHRNRQEDRRVRLQNRVVSTTARRALHTLSRN